MEKKIKMKKVDSIKEKGIERKIWKKGMALFLCISLISQLFCIQSSISFAEENLLTATASHSYYINNADPILGNYGKGNYVHSAFTISGKGMNKEQIFSVKDLEALAYNKSLNLGYEDTYSLMTRGSEFSKHKMTGVKLYDFLVYCGIDTTLPNNTPIQAVARDGYKTNLTLGELKNNQYGCFSNKDATDAEKTGLPVMLSFASDGKPLTGPTGQEASGTKFQQADGYDLNADNGGGPLRLTVGQKSASEYNAPYNGKWITKIIVGEQSDYTFHKGAEATQVALNVTVYDSISKQKIKEKAYSLQEIETFAAASSENTVRNYYDDGNFYEGVNLWKLLTQSLEISGVEGQIEFLDTKGSKETLDLSYLRNLSGDFNHYMTMKEALPITCVKPTLAYSINGAATSNGAIFAALPQDGNYNMSASVSTCTGISVYVGVPTDIHNQVPYSQYKDQKIAITGAGVKVPTEITVDQIEAQIGLSVTKQFTAKSEIATYRGISLIDYLDEKGLTVDAENVILSKEDGSHITLSIEDLRKASEPTLLAYSRNGVPLVPTESSVGYDPASKNAGGPIVAVHSNQYLENVKTVTVSAKAGNWNHSAAGYESYLDTPLRIYGSQAKSDTTITLGALENLKVGTVRDSFAASGGTNGYQGIALRSLIEPYLKEGVTKPSTITIVGDDGYQTAISVDDVYDGIESTYQNGAHRDIILAYSMDGVPLVPGASSVGYTVDNGYGPLRLVVENAISSWVKGVSAIIIGDNTAPTNQVNYTIHYVQTKARSANGDQGIPSLGYTEKTFQGTIGESVTIDPANAPGWIYAEYQDADGKSHLAKGKPTLTLKADSSKNVLTLRYNVNAGFIIHGDGLNHEYWYSYDDLQQMAQKSQDLSYVAKEDNCYETKLYSVVKRGNVPANLFGSGLDVTKLLTSVGGIGLQTVTFYAADGGLASLSQGPFDFTKNQLKYGDYYYYPQVLLSADQRSETGKTPVLPMLAFQSKELSWEYDKVDDRGEPLSGAIVTKVPTLESDIKPIQDKITNGTEDLNQWDASIASPYPTLMLGQTSFGDFNNTYFTKMIHGMLVGTAKDSLTIQKNGAKVKAYSLGTFVKNGLEPVDFSPEKEGVAVDRLLKLANTNYNSSAVISFGQKGKEITSANVGQISHCYLSINADDQNHMIDSANPLILTYLSGSAVTNQPVDTIQVVSQSSNGDSTGGGGAAGVVVETPKKTVVPREYLVKDTTKVATKTETKAEIKTDAKVDNKTAASSSGSSTFQDVKKDAWYYNSMNYIVNQGIFKGTSQSTFSPQLTMTRAMFVTALGRLHGKDISGAKSTFTDVQEGQWYSASASWAAANGIVNGDSKTSFAPDLAISREQMAVFLYRYANFTGYKIKAQTASTSQWSDFSDKSKVSPWASEAMQWAVSTGLMKGVSAGQLDPQGETNRAQVASIIERFADLTGTKASQVSGTAISSSGSAVSTSNAAVKKETATTQETNEKYAVIPKTKEYLTVKGDGVNRTLYLTYDDLNSLKTLKVTYSGRNKENNNARQYRKCTGVNIVTLINLAGWNGSANTIKITCSDGYTKKYDISDLDNNYVSFANDSDSEGYWVPAMIALLSDGTSLGNSSNYKSSDGAPFRLVFGQEIGDSDASKSFNMQGWANYVKTIEIY